MCEMCVFKQYMKKVYLVYGVRMGKLKPIAL